MKFPPGRLLSRRTSARTRRAIERGEKGLDNGPAVLVARVTHSPGVSGRLLLASNKTGLLCMNSMRERLAPSPIGYFW